MRSLIKFSLLALVCLSMAELIHPAGVIAGDKPVALPDSGSSGLGDTFSPAPRNASGSRTSARISRELAEALQLIQTRQSVASVNGRSLALSPEEVAAIVDAVSTGADIEALEQSLNKEMGGLDLKISALAVSPENLSMAVKANNELVLSLDSEQLAAAVESPIFIALLRLLEAANQTTGDRGDRAAASADILAEQGAMSLLQISRP